MHSIGRRTFLRSAAGAAALTLTSHISAYGRTRTFKVSATTSANLADRLPPDWYRRKIAQVQQEMARRKLDGVVSPAKAPPRYAEPRDWLAWAEVHGATLDHWGAGGVGAVPGAPLLYGNQVNLLAGVTRRLMPNFLVGVLGGYENFDYRSDALQGRLKGDGWTVGSYLGWMISQHVRFDAAVTYSGIGYDGLAGTAAGTFSGQRWLATGGLTGNYKAYGFLIEPSARIYALWEHENAYTDSLGTLQMERNFSSGRASCSIRA